MVTVEVMRVGWGWGGLSCEQTPNRKTWSTGRALKTGRQSRPSQTFFEKQTETEEREEGKEKEGKVKKGRYGESGLRERKYFTLP